ncbi:MAG: hypothetical protein OEY70_04020, partial [Acidimicrobiia bacterium]|nr:hypothetical protein [Acidimicrobiia bacterium]
IGSDLGELDPHRPIGSYDFNAMTGLIKGLAESAPDRSWTFGDLAKRQMTGQFLVGSPEQIADRLASFAEVGADGFNLVYTTTPGTFVDFIEGVGPELQRRGLMRADNEPGTLRDRLFGHPRLPDTHPGARVRRHPSRN